MVWKPKKILLPYDGSELSDIAIEPAVEIAQREGGELICLYVVNVPGIWSAPFTESRADMVEFMKGEGDTCLEKPFKAAEAAGVKAKKVVKEGSPAAIIAATAKEEDAELIVMSSHGSHSSRSYLGSVARSVVDRSEASVLIVKPAELADMLEVTYKA